MIELFIERTAPEDGYTIGTLSIDHFDGKGRQPFCNTLERQLRVPFVKVPGQTAIPAGRYSFTLVDSVHNKCIVPLLDSVPQFDSIEIHPGNTAHDSKGCILLGDNDIKGRVDSSQITFAHFMTVLKASGQDLWWITIENPEGYTTPEKDTIPLPEEK